MESLRESLRESISGMLRTKKKKPVSFQAFEEIHENDPPMSYIETMMHLFKGNVGTGVYAMGEAIMNGGLVVGPIVTLIIAFICVHAQHMLIRSAEYVKAEYGLSKRPDYAETVEMSFSISKSPWCSRMAQGMKNTCNIFICVTQVGFCSVYFLFVSENVNNVLSFHGYNIDKHAAIALVLIPIFLMILTRQLKYIAIFSGVANVFMISGIVLTLYYATVDLPPLSDRHYFADFMRLPHFFGTALFAFEGIALVLPLQNAMKEPKDFSRPLGVLNVGMVLVSIIFVVVGIIGYWQYGEGTEASLTLNLPTERILAQVVILMIASGVMLGFSIQFFVPVQIIFPILSDYWKLTEKHPICCELIFRSLLVLLTFALAQLIPNLGLLLSLIGSLCCVVLAFVFPVFTELIIVHNSPKGAPYWMWIKDIVILLIAIIGFFVGGSLNMKEVVQEVITNFSRVTETVMNE